MAGYKYDRHEIFGGGIYRLVAPNNPEFPKDAVWDAYNMVYERSSEDPEKMKGFTRLGANTVNDVPSGIFDYSEGTQLIVTSEDGGVYKRTTGDWSTVTGGGAGTFSTVDDTRWSGKMVYGATTASKLLVLSNGVNAPQKYNGTTISNLGGSPPAAGKYITQFAGRYWMATGDTLHYSAADDAEEWSTGAGSFQVDRGSGDITGLYAFAGNLLAFKRRKIVRLAVGDTLSSANLKDVSNVIGTPSHYTISETSGSTRTGTLLFMSDEGIHEIRPTFDTGAFYIPNAAESVKPLLDRRDTSNFPTCWATYNPPRGEYWLQYNLNDSRPDEGLIGNLARGRTPRWTMHDMRDKTAGAMYISSGAQVQIIGQSNGRIYQLHSTDARDSAGYRGFITTASYPQGERYRWKVYGRIFIDANTNGTYPILSYYTLGRTGLPSPAGGNNSPANFGAEDGWGVGEWGVAIWGGATSNGQFYRLNEVRRGAWIRMRFETTGASQWFQLNGLAVEYAKKRAMLAA
jgi:hypothetical protein